MTNKEKYPNAEIIQNPSAPQECGGTWYIRLVSEFEKRDQYLLKNQQVGPHDHDNPSNTYFPSEAAAKTALDNFMNKIPEITLKEIKRQYEEAKKLIGKKIKKLQGNFIGEIFKVAGVKLILEQENFPYSEKALSFLRENGYVIFLANSSGHSRVVFDNGCFTVINEVSVIAHDGQTYAAESDGDCWKFGCARISKTLIKQSLNLMNDKNFGGNRQIEKITIGKCDFTRETLKALVELGE